MINLLAPWRGSFHQAFIDKKGRPAGIVQGGLDVCSQGSDLLSVLTVVFVFGSMFLGAAFFLARLTAAGVFFFFKVDLVAFFVEYLVFEIVERLVGQDAEFALEFPAPFPVFAHNPFLEIGIDKRMDIHNEAVHFERVDKVINLVFQHIGKKQ